MFFDQSTKNFLSDWAKYFKWDSFALVLSLLPGAILTANMTTLILVQNV